MLVKPKNLERFRRYVTDLFAYMNKIIDPKHKKKIHHALKKYREMNKEQYLEDTLYNLEKYIDQLARSDEIIFTPEYLKAHKVRYLNFLPGFDFSLLWRQNLTLDQKTVIFRYLMYLYLQASTATGRNRDKVKLIIESLKTIDELEEEAAENPNLDDEGNPGGLSNLKDIFGEDSLLMDIANELTEEVNFQETMKEIMSGISLGQQGDNQPANPMEMINKLLQNPKLHETMTNMQQKMNTKFQEKNVTQEDLLKSVNTLQENLGNEIGKMIPGGKSQIKKMMKSMNIEQMVQGMAQQQMSTTDSQTASTSSGQEEGVFQVPDAENFGNFMNMMQGNPQIQAMMEQMQKLDEGLTDEQRQELQNDPSKINEHLDLGKLLSGIAPNPTDN